MIDLNKLKELAHSLSILYVEDDPSVQIIVQNYLQKLFARVVTADDGAEGLAAYKREKFDIVITDISMPGMNGLELIAHIRELDFEQSILITTAYTDVKNMTTAIKYGVDGYIIKPFDYAQMNYELYKIAQKLQKIKANTEYKKHLQELVAEKTSALRLVMEQEKENYEHTLLSLVDMIDKRDSYTAGHSRRVSSYSYKIAMEMGYSEEECLQLSKAGVLHDIGKIATPDIVLLKPKSLTELEYTLIKEHVNVGYAVLKEIPMFEELAHIMRDHHERCDGSGYPRGIKADVIHPLAKVMMVADTFDAMTTNRIYKGKKGIKEALDEIESLSPLEYDRLAVNAAKIALKDVVIPKDINQLPSSDIEKERFAYFYKDHLTQLYNKNYLDVVLVQNEYKRNFTTLVYVKLQNFSKFNKEQGWNSGDNLLKKVAISLKKNSYVEMIFNVFGDDFVILDDGKCNVQTLQIELNEALKTTVVTVNIEVLDMQVHNINSADDLENL